MFTLPHIHFVFFGFSLIASFFEMNPFEPWTTRDKVDRVCVSEAEHYNIIYLDYYKEVTYLSNQ